MTFLSDAESFDVTRTPFWNIFIFQDIQGETALHKAARNGNAECVSYLIATNCNVR